MVFWICLGVLIIGIILRTVVYHYSTNDLVSYISLNVGIWMIIISVFILMIIFIPFTFSRIEINAEAEFAAGLASIAENEDAFRDDSAKEEFTDELQTWNEKIAIKKEIQNNFWSIFYPLITKNAITRKESDPNDKRK